MDGERSCPCTARSPAARYKPAATAGVLDGGFGGRRPWLRLTVAVVPQWFLGNRWRVVSVPYAKAGTQRPRDRSAARGVNMSIRYAQDARKWSRPGSRQMLYPARHPFVIGNNDAIMTIWGICS